MKACCKGLDFVVAKIAITTSTIQSAATKTVRYEKYDPFSNTLCNSHEVSEFSDIQKLQLLQQSNCAVQRWQAGNSFWQEFIKRHQYNGIYVCEKCICDNSKVQKNCQIQEESSYCVTHTCTHTRTHSLISMFNIQLQATLYFTASLTACMSCCDVASINVTQYQHAYNYIWPCVCLCMCVCACWSMKPSFGKLMHVTTFEGVCSLHAD